MGIATNLIPVVLDAVRAHGPKGRLLQLGRQDLEAGAEDLAGVLQAEGFEPRTPAARWSEVRGVVEPESFFSALGFGPVESLDVSDVEGADHTFDLNSPKVPREWVGRWDAVFDGGTLEHVFHLPNALASLHEMLAPSGWFLHVGPLNNYVDHGFWQFSPTLWFDWFFANGWDVLDSALLRLPPVRGTGDGRWEISPLPPGRLKDVGALDDAPYMHWLVARKGREARGDRVPAQRMYAKRCGVERAEGDALRDFEAFAVVGGRRLDLGAPSTPRPSAAPSRRRRGWMRRLLGGR